MELIRDEIIKAVRDNLIIGYQSASERNVFAKFRPDEFGRPGRWIAALFKRNDRFTIASIEHAELRLSRGGVVVS